MTYQKIDNSISVKVLKEAGYEEAMLGLSLNKLQPVENMPNVAERLSKASAGSHRKFLRQIQVWVELTLPLYVWIELDTYKVGTVRQSSSTMHKPLHHTEFLYCTPATIQAYTEARQMYEEGKISIEEFKANIPCGLLMKSVLSLNYEVIRTIINDRHNHRLQTWRNVCKELLKQIQHPELISVM